MSGSINIFVDSRPFYDMGDQKNYRSTWDYLMHVVERTQTNRKAVGAGVAGSTAATVTIMGTILAPGIGTIIGAVLGGLFGGAVVVMTHNDQLYKRLINLNAQERNVLLEAINNHFGSLSLQIIDYCLKEDIIADLVDQIVSSREAITVC